MCHECQAIDKTIDHYRRLEKHTTEHGTLASIQILIAKLGAEKTSLHCDAPRFGKVKDRR